MALTKIKTGGIADNAITNAKMADNAIDSIDIAAGSIDNAHLAGSIAVSKTLLAGGTGLTLSTNTLNVDAAQTQITSVGTLTTLQVGGQNSTPKLEWFYDHSDNNDYKANISLAGNDLEVRGSSGTMEFYTGAVDGASSTKALSIDSSQNVKIETGSLQLNDVAQSIDFIQSGAINFDSNGDQTGRVLTIGSNRAGGASGGTTNVTFAEDGTSTFSKAVTLGTQSSGLNAFNINRARFQSHENNNADMSVNLAYNGSAWVNDNDSQDSQLLRLYSGAGLFYYVASAAADPNLSEKFKVDTSGNGTFTGNLIVNGTGSDIITGDYLYLDAHNNTAAKNVVFRQLNDTWMGQIEFSPSGTSQIVTRVNQPLAFGVNNSQKMTIETDGSIKSTSGMYFTGNALHGTNTGISSSGDGGNLRVYISGNQNYTFSGHTLTIDSQGNGTPAQLTCKNNGSSGWTGAAVNLLYEGSDDRRGQGVYMHSQASDTEWYAGTMYSVDNDRYSICYESTASWTEATAAAAHEVFYIGTSGQAWSGGGYWNTYNSAVNHGLASYTNELNICNSWTSGQNQIHFNYRMGNTYGDFTFFNGSSSGYPDLNAGSFDTTSDYRMKKSVTNFTANVCDKIKLLRPVTYKWKANTKMTEAQQIGFLAHELQEQLPLAVKGEKDAMSEKDNTKIAPQTIKGEALSSYMIKALQEIITRLEALENA